MSDKKSNTEEVYYPETLLPEVPGMGWSRFAQGTPGGPRPSGSKTYEICFITKGSVEWWLGDELHEAWANYLFINNPGEWHGGTSGMLQPCELYWVQFYFPPDGKLPSLSQETIQPLKQTFTHLTKRYFPAPVYMHTLFAQLLDEQRQQKLYAQDNARALFHQILMGTARAYLAQQSQSYSEPIRKVLRWIDEHLTVQASTEVLAEQASMSVTLFYKVFLQELGLSPAEYYLRQRLVKAKQLLRQSSLGVTEIALSLGFSSSQYFATAFKKHIGLTPSKYRSLRQAGLVNDTPGFTS